MRASDHLLASLPPPDAPPALERGTSVGRFLVLGLVGRGAMGEVYAAYDPELDRKIAIKLLRARHEAAEHRARLMREAKATAKISHPNVVVVFDAGAFGERVFIAMEFVEGHTLRYWLQAQPRDWHEILDAFVAAGRGLAAAHEKDLVHRDFKPDNVMVTAQGGQVRVMDFGLARFVANATPDLLGALSDLDGTIEIAPGGALPIDATPVLDGRDRLTMTGTILGTPAYMSPEQFRSQPADARSDQFSFCVALYEALFQQRPFMGHTLQELSENVLAGRLRDAPAASRVPASVRPVIARGLAARPEDRFPAMQALLEALVRASSAGRNSFARGAAAKLAGVWEAPVDGRSVETADKEAMRQAFLSTGKPYAASTFSAASAVLDRYTKLWSDLYVEVCEATHVRGEQSAEILDLRMACLNEGLDDLKALCRLFREATSQVVENAVKAAAALGTLDRCSDIKLLRAVVRPPDDPTTREAVEVVRRRFVEVRALQRVGKWTTGLDAVGPLVEEARRAGYAPMTAEVLLLKGQLQIDSAVIGDGTTALQEAFATAIQARHDEIAALAAVMLCYSMGYLKGRFEVGELWGIYAEALLRRMGGQDALWGWYYIARADMRELQGRLAESVEDTRQAAAALERAAGPGSFELATVYGNLSNHLAFGGDFVGALAAADRSLAICAATVGPDHPRAALVVANQAQFLYRLGRYEDALKTAAQALAVLDRETDPRGIIVSVPLRAIGLCRLAQGRPRDAISVLERALAIREAISVSALRLAEVRAPLARALYELPGEKTRALALARQARTDYEPFATMPVVRLDLAELDRWIAERDPPRGAEVARRPRPPRARARSSKPPAKPERKPEAPPRARKPRR